MRKELDELLCRKYPEIFRDRHGNKLETCMCWGFECGDGWFDLIDVLCKSIQHKIDSNRERIADTERHNSIVLAARAGNLAPFEDKYKNVEGNWKDKYLADILSTEDDGTDWSHGLRPVPDEIPQIVAVQVKEKFAGLRFYIGANASDEIWGMIEYAEALSTRICEECGAPGTVGGRGWVKTRCEKHQRPGEEDTYRQLESLKILPKEQNVDA